MAEHVLTCRTCGVQFLHPRRNRYCGPECYPSRSRIRFSERYAGAVCRTEHKCQGCGKGFLPKAKDRTKFCSRDCAYRNSSLWVNSQGAKDAVLKRKALEAIADTMRVRVSVRMNLPMQGPPVPPMCDCGTPLHRYAKSGMCRPCLEARAKSRTRTKTAGTLAAKRRSRLARKARQRGARVENVDPVDVLSRDGWRCQLCGVKTPRSLRGTFDPRAPEVDHIIPISVGGDHSYRNTQCTCRACNIAKAATPRGQLRLF